MFFHMTSCTLQLQAGMVNLLILQTHLRGHQGVPDTVSGPLIVPLNYFAILPQIQLKAYMTSEIACFHMYWNSAFPTPRCPLNLKYLGNQLSGSLGVFSIGFVNFCILNPMLKNLSDSDHRLQRYFHLSVPYMMCALTPYPD